MKPLLLAAFALVTVALAGCSGGDGKPAPAPPTDVEGQYVIHMTSGNQFSPRDATVPKGAVVRWENDGPAPHDVQAKDGSFDSGAIGNIPAKQSWTHTFNNPGTYDYFCEAHGSSMSGKITVTA